MANTFKIGVKTDWFISAVLNTSRPYKEFSTSTTSGLIFDNPQIVGTTHELVAVGDVTDDSIMIVENTHATATVQVGAEVAAAFVPFIDIPPGGPPAILPRASTLAATYLKSDTATTTVRVTLVKIV